MKQYTTPVILAADAAIDLQMHTTFSDGSWTPEQLIDYLVSEQFGLAAITDHERVDTLEYARKHHLLTSSGSDSHGPEKKPIKYRAELSRDLLERLGVRIK